MTAGSRPFSVLGSVAAFAAIASLVSLDSLHAASKALFPAPLHLTRELVSPVSKAKSVVEEYCHGNRVVSVSGSRTAIVDYDKNEVTEIDFAAGTYSVTKFETIAKSRQGMQAAAMSTQARDWRVEPRGGSVVASRPGETVEAERTSNRIRHSIRITADRQMTLSRGAVEALLGLSYPSTPDASAGVVLDALRAERPRRTANSTDANANADGEYRLPLEHIVRFDMDGEIVESRSVVTRVGSELAPPDVLAIPPGAKLVDSSIVAARKQLEELERPASSQR